MEKENRPPKGYRALRRGRVTLPNTRYFITIVTKDRKTGLDSYEAYTAIINITEQLPCSTKAFVLMPDHIHWLLTLDASSALPEMIRLFKGKLSPILRDLNLEWQKGAYHDRRLRPDDELAPFLRYMLCNPYRKQLCSFSEAWKYWYCVPETWEWFKETTIDGRPHPEWMLADANPPWETEPQP